MIEPGQLRRWRDGALAGEFLVIRSQGKFLPLGATHKDKKQDHWEILTVDGPMVGWSDNLLDKLSEPIR